jgi:integrase
MNTKQLRHETGLMHRTGPDLPGQTAQAEAGRGTAQAPESRRITFGEFATEWLARREVEGLSEGTLVDVRWSLKHLLPFFKDHRIAEITAQAVDQYKVAKARKRTEIEAAREKGEKVGRTLSDGSINHTLRHLAQILEDALDYGLIQSNPAEGKKRRLPAKRPNRPWVEPEQLMALLDATSGVGRVLLGLLAGAGLRIGESAEPALATGRPRHRNAVRRRGQDVQGCP